MKKLGQEYISEFSGEDIQAELLAEELGINEFRFPDEHYQHTEVVIQQLVAKIIPFLRGLEKEQIGDYLVDHREELFAIFDTFPEMHRIPLLVRKNVLISHGLLSAQLMGMTSTEFFNAFLHCMHFYLYLKSVRNLSQLYERYPHTQHSRPIIDMIVRDECNNEIKCAWGMRSSYFFNSIVPGQKGSDLVQSMLHQDAYIIPRDLRGEYKRKKVMFWRQEGLSPERILLNISHLVEDRISPTDQEKLTELDVPALNFFLCQNDILGYEEIISKIFRNPDHTATWVAWTKKYFDILMSRESQARKVFYYVFGIEGNLFENGAIPNRLKRIKEKTKKGSTEKGLPQEICDVLEAKYRLYRDKMRQEKKNQSAQTVVAKITSPTSPNTAMSALLARPAQPTKIIVPSLDIKSVLPDFETSRGVNKQLTQIDFSACDFPEGTVVTVERALPSKKKDVFEVIEGVDPRGKNTIEPVLGKDIQGQFAYKITIVLPLTHRFEGDNVFKVSYYAKAEPTPAEIEAERVQREALKNQPKIFPETVTTLVVAVEEKVESTIDPVANSLIAASFVLAEKQEQYAIQDSYRGGPIHITLTDADCVEVLGDESAALLSEHKHWTVNEDDSINPSVQDADVLVVLRTITEKIRENYRLKQEQEQKETREKQEIAEYESQRKNFEPLLEFARNFKFEGKENGNFEDQKTILREELKKLGWSIPVAWAGNQVVWRHMQSNIRILYTSKICTGYEIQTETKGTLTPALKKCYEEVAEAFAHIARFFNAETRERKKMITREQTMRKEVENSAVSYDALLAKGQARLVLFSPYQKSYGAWSSKFPAEKTPHMLDERASHGTIESLLQQYSHAELCYRRDLLCINGEIADDASQESIENTSLNITELRHSPRARYILKKRILITLKLEKFPDETDRAPIKHEKNKREGRISALDILLRMKNEKAVQTSSDITDDFISGYIDELEKNRIRVHYVWPLSSRLDEHRTRMKKHAAKVAAAEADKTTAD